MELASASFIHRAYVKLHPDETRLIVFIEGDGTPWVDHGRREATDPTPRNPLLLRLAARTPGSVLYLGRPCYFGHSNDERCSTRMWTSARYSEAVVSSLTEVLRDFMKAHRKTSVVLVGHSGGGTLAVLIAPRLPAVTGVLTLAGNLDIDAWTTMHHYLPLEESLNPAELPKLPAPITERHLTAVRDESVPRAAAERYLDRLPPEDVVAFESFDHVCCWERDWQPIWQDFATELN